MIAGKSLIVIASSSLPPLIDERFRLSRGKDGVAKKHNTASR
jgi:hypothetical protein